MSRRFFEGDFDLSSGDPAALERDWRSGVTPAELLPDRIENFLIPHESLLVEIDQRTGNSTVDDLEKMWRALDAQRAGTGLVNEAASSETPLNASLKLYEDGLKKLFKETMGLLAHRLQPKGALQDRTKRFATRVLSDALRVTAQQMILEARTEGIELLSDAGCQFALGGSIEPQHKITDFNDTYRALCQQSGRDLNKEFGVQHIIDEVRIGLQTNSSEHAGRFARAVLTQVFAAHLLKRISSRARNGLVAQNRNHGTIREARLSL
jgi:hypothetical protein